MEATTENKTFCVMPFLHLNVWMDGNLKACCISNDFKNVNILNSSVKDAYNSEEYKQLRRDMLNGIENPLCSGCYNTEKINSRSYRVAQLEKYKDVINEIKSSVKSDGEVDLNFRDMDLRFSRLCNLKCRGCNDTFSSSWDKETVEFAKLKKWDDPPKRLNSVNLDLDKSTIKNLSHLYFAGGEPLFMDGMYDFIDKIENKDEILFFINTNFTVVNYKTFEHHFADFKLVQFIISCDGIDEIGVYTRTNMKWKKFIKNLDLLKKYEKKLTNLTHIFQYTCSVLNCFHFFEFRDFMYENGYVTCDEQIKFGFVEGPPWLTVVNFDDLKMDVIKYFEERIILIRKDTNLHVEITNFLNFLKENHSQNKDQHNMLKSVIEFGHEFNKTKLPEELQYIEKLFKLNKSPI